MQCSKGTNNSGNEQRKFGASGKLFKRRLRNFSLRKSTLADRFVRPPGPVSVVRVSESKPSSQPKSAFRLSSRFVISRARRYTAVGTRTAAVQLSTTQFYLAITFPDLPRWSPLLCVLLAAAAAATTYYSLFFVLGFPCFFFSLFLGSLGVGVRRRLAVQSTSEVNWSAVKSSSRDSV